MSRKFGRYRPPKVDAATQAKIQAQGRFYSNAVREKRRQLAERPAPLPDKPVV